MRRPEETDGGWFVKWMANRKLLPAVHLLKPWARWITPDAERRRFDTMFYVAMYEGSLSGRHNHHEAEDLRWFSPDEILRDAAHGKLTLPPPTFVCLSEFLHFPTLADLLRAASCRVVSPLQPHVKVDETGRISILMDNDEDHPRNSRAEGPRTRNRVVFESPTSYHVEQSPLSHL